MNKLSIFLRLLCFVQVSCLVPGDKVFTDYRGRTISFFTSVPLKFADAVKDCGARGGCLAEFKNLEDVKWLNSAITGGEVPLTTEYFYVGGFYAGFKDGTSGPGTFQWFESGSDVTFWGPSQPDHLRPTRGWDEPCCVAYVSEVAGPPFTLVWSMGDLHCITLQSYICSFSK